MKDPLLYSTLSEFLPEVGIEDIIPYGTGHINKTYQVLTEPSHGRSYILQQINHNIFKDVPGMQENISRVTEHIFQKIKNLPGIDLNREALRLIPTRSNLSYFKDDKGNYWRLYVFIEGSRCYQKAPSFEIAFEAGKAFGRFQRYLEDITGGPLHETIPDFHDMQKRLVTFEKAISEGKGERIQESAHEIDFVKSRAGSMVEFINRAKENKVPLRITHNDSKLNNVLFDEQNRALCIVDLDTVMQGYVFYDFGDAIRTLANTAEEDEQDLSRVSIEMNLYKAFAGGFLAEAEKALTPEEISGLAFSCQYMTFIIGLRFLTDYLQHDWYFRIHREKHNLERARVQFRLVEDMETKYPEMKNIAESTRDF
jgi:hypothetical protein